MCRSFILSVGHSIHQPFCQSLNFSFHQWILRLEVNHSNSVTYSKTNHLAYFSVNQFTKPISYKSLDSSVGIALGYGMTIGVLGFDSRRGLRIFLFTIASRTALGPTQPPIQWVPGALSPRLKRPVCEADHSSPPSAEVKNTWNYNSIPPIRFHGAILS
jgi:hypothetical protein